MYIGKIKEGNGWDQRGWRDGHLPMRILRHRIPETSRSIELWDAWTVFDCFRDEKLFKLGKLVERRIREGLLVFVSCLARAPIWRVASVPSLALFLLPCLSYVSCHYFFFLHQLWHRSKTASANHSMVHHVDITYWWDRRHHGTRESHSTTSCCTGIVHPTACIRHWGSITGSSWK